jgi:kinesin family protein C1
MVNKGLESDLKDTQSCLNTVRMELETTKRSHTFETDDLRRKLRNEIEDVEFKYEKDAKRMIKDRDDSEEKMRKEYEVRIDKMLAEHRVELAELQKKVDADVEAERIRRIQEAGNKEAEYESRLRTAAIDADAKQREMQLIQGDQRQVGPRPGASAEDQPSRPIGRLDCQQSHTRSIERCDEGEDPFSRVRQPSAIAGLQ